MESAQKYKYKAFISYRHQPFDKAVATKLRRQLESYRPPGKIGRDFSKWMLFRDQDELTTGHNLSDKIKGKLEESEYLIVICSRKLKESRWCREEIRYFKSIHGGSTRNILPVLIEGSMEDCVPKELFCSVEDGMEKRVEPLAANIISDRRSKSFQLLKKEKLRIAAEFLGRGYDDLYQREKKRRMIRYGILGGAIFLVLAVIAVLSVAFAITVSDKNVQISNQNEAILEMNQQMEQQNESLLIENSQHLVFQSRTLWNAGSPIEAIESCLSALPSEENERPVITEAEYLLADEIDACKTDSFRPVLALEHSGTVEAVRFAGNGKNIVTTEGDNLYFWNSTTGELIRKYAKEELGLADSEYISDYNFEFKPYKLEAVDLSKNRSAENGEISFVSDYLGYFNCKKTETDITEDSGDFYFTSAGGIKKIDGETGDILCSIDQDTEYISGDIILDLQYTYGDTTARYASVQLNVIDSDTGKISQTYDASVLEEYGFTDIQYYSLEYESLILVVKAEDGTYYLAAAKIENGEVQKPIPIDVVGSGFSIYCSAASDKHWFYCASTEVNGMSKQFVKAVNMETLKEEWTYFSDIISLIMIMTKLDMGFLYAEDTGNFCDVLYFAAGSQLLLLNAETGDLIHTFEFNDVMVYSYHAADGNVFIISHEGQELLVPAVNILENKERFACAETVSFQTQPYFIDHYREKYALASDDSNMVYVYWHTENPEYSELFRISSSYEKFPACLSTPVTRKLLLSETGSYAVYETENEDGTACLFSFDILRDTHKKIMDTEQWGLDYYTVYFMDPAHIAIVPDNGEKIYICDIVTGERKEISCDKYTSIWGSGNGRLTYKMSTGALWQTDTDGNIAAFPSDSEYELGMSMAVMKDDQMQAAYIANHYTTSKNLITTSETLVKVLNMKSQSITILSGADVSDSYDGLLMTWLDENTAALIEKKNRMRIYDLDTGSCLRSVALAENMSDPVYMFPLDGGESIAVFTEDFVLYKVSAQTGRIEERVELEKADSTSAYDVKYLSDGSGFIFSADVTSNTRQGWVFNGESFQPRFCIKHYLDYQEETNRVFIGNKYSGTFGYFPLYTTDQLIENAQEYLEMN